MTTLAVVLLLSIIALSTTGILAVLIRGAVLSASDAERWAVEDELDREAASKRHDEWRAVMKANRDALEESGRRLAELDAERNRRAN